MKRKYLIILFLILIVGSVLRLAGLKLAPPSLNWDEVSHGYNAYSILKTGKDEWGQFLPILNFRAYGDYPTPLNIYLTIPFIAFFGLNEFSIRLPHALLGILTIISTYFLVWGITKKRDMSLFAAFLVAVGPWYVFTSRFVLQANLAVFFLISAMALFFNRDRNKFFLPLSIFSLFLTLFSYHTTRIFSPLLLISLLFIYKQEIRIKFEDKRVSFISFLLIGLFFVSVFLIYKTPKSKTRGNVLFLIDQGAVNKIIEKRNSSRLPSILKRIIYNRPIYFVGEFSRNYISYFSPRFLFLEGGTQYQFSIPKKGLIYLINVPLFYLGLFLVAKKALKDKNYRLIFMWLVLFPIPASLTNEKFAVLRATTLLPLPEIFIALAAGVVLEKLTRYKWVLIPLYFFGILISLETYFLAYFTIYRTSYSWAWQYGYKEAVNYTKNHYNNYDKIIVTKKYGEPHEFLLFFWPWDPEKYRNDPYLVRFYQSNWYWVDKFDKFYFVNDWQVPGSGQAFVLESKDKVDCAKAKCLLITSPSNYPEGWKKLETINFLDGKPAFEILDNGIL